MISLNGEYIYHALCLDSTKTFRGNKRFLGKKRKGNDHPLTGKA
jgi:hypothetical protein